jgi:Putative Flp pilus-assembly TadE/G-like
MTRLLHRAREERAQTLVFFVVLMGGLIFLLAFVLNVGAVANTQREAQSLADGAALAGVQKLSFDCGSSSICQTSFPDSQTVRVDVSRQVPGFLLPLVSAPTAHATASARIEPAHLLDNQMLRKVSTPNPKPYLVQLVVAAACASCTDLSASDLGFICVESGPCRASSMSSQVASGLQDSTQVVAGTDVPGVRATPASLSSLPENEPLIVPIYSSFTNCMGRRLNRCTYHLVGFADMVITGAPSPGEITADFEPYTAPGTLDNFENTSPNYGVSVIGLTQ